MGGKLCRFPENSPCPETQNKMVSSSKGVKVVVSGLDHWFSALQLHANR